VVAEIPNRQLADEAPLYDRPHTSPPAAPSSRLGSGDGAPAIQSSLPRLLASPDLCSKRWIWEQYDFQVRTNTVAGPGRDAAIVRVKETGSSLAISLDGNGRYCYLSPREGAMLAVAECCRNLSTVGAQPVAATNCLNFGNPERPEIMAQLVEAIEGLGEACRFFATPITGGNVSLYNETLGEGIYPTPVVGIVGLLKTEPPVSMSFRHPGRSVILLGGVGSADQTQFGSSQYAKIILNQLWGLPPTLDLDREKRVQAAIREIVNQGLAESAHDLSDGGLAVALAECSIGQVADDVAGHKVACPTPIGARVDLNSELPAELVLFHEGPSRVLLSTAAPEQVAAVAARHQIEAPVVGVTIESEVVIERNERVLGRWEIKDLQAAFEEALPSQIEGA
jgi:phosphoribosylformylglycinamidine synthase